MDNKDLVVSLSFSFSRWWHPGQTNFYFTFILLDTLPTYFTIVVLVPLFNTYPKEILEARLWQEKEPRLTVSFYYYTTIESTQALRNRLYHELSSIDVLGRIYIALEGINAQISIPQSQYKDLENIIRAFPCLKDVYLNQSVIPLRHAFLKLVIKCRKYIVSDGLKESDLDMTKRGNYISPAEFNKIMQKKNVITIDLRNHYETEVGHFEGAILLNTDSFRETLQILPDLIKEHKKKKILLYCTGGVRCEKASSFLLSQGFSNISQLKGGIIHYFREVVNGSLGSMFKGKNFVFDQRLGEKVSHKTISHCHQCHMLSDEHTNCRNKECHVLFIQCARCSAKFEGCCSEACKEINRLPEWVQKALRKGKRNPTRTARSSKQFVVQPIL